MKNFFYIIFALLLITACSTSKQNYYGDQNKEVIAADWVSADKAFKEGNYPKAAKLYERLVGENSTNQENSFRYAESLRLSGETKKANSIYDNILSLNPGFLSATEGKSLSYLQDGEFKKSASLLSSLLKVDASNWRAINALGVIYALTGHVDEASEYYEMALELSANNPSVMNNIGLAKAFSGDAKNGLLILENALLALKPNDEVKKRKIEYNLAMVYGISGDMDKAEELLSRTMPEHRVMNNLGFYAKLAKEEKLAKTYLSKALASSPVYYEKAWNNLNN